MFINEGEGREKLTVWRHWDHFSLSVALASPHS